MRPGIAGIAAPFADGRAGTLGELARSVADFMDAVGVASAHGKTFVDADALAIEVKSRAWVLAPKVFWLNPPVTSNSSNRQVWWPDFLSEV